MSDLTSFAKLHRLSSNYPLKNLNHVNFETKSMVPRSPKLDLLFKTIVDIPVSDNELPFVSWKDSELLDLYFDFVEGVVTFGEATGEEMATILDQTNQIVRLLIDSFCLQGCDPVETPTDSLNKSHPRVRGDLRRAVSRLTPLALQKISIKALRNYSIFFDVVDRLFFYKALKIFDKEHREIPVREFAAKFQEMLTAIFQTESPADEGKEDEVRRKKEGVTKYFGSVLSRLVAMLRKESAQLALKLAGLVLSGSVRDDLAGYVSPETHRVWINFLRMDPEVTKKMTQCMAAATADFYRIFGDKKTEAGKCYEGSPDSIEVAFKFHYGPFVSKNHFCPKTCSSIRILLGQLAWKLVRRPPFFQWLQQTQLHFGDQQTRLLKAFSCDPQAFDHYIIDFERMRTQIMTLQRHMRDAEATEAAQTFRAETERVLDKINCLFAESRSHGLTSKLQEVLSRPAFYQPLIDFLVSVESLDPPKASNIDEPIYRLVRQVISLLEVFARGNPVTSGFSARYLTSLINLMEKGYDLAVLLRLLLDQLRGGEFSEVLSLTYHRVLSNLLKMGAQKLGEMNSKVSYKNMEVGVKSLALAKGFGHRLAARSASSFLIRTQRLPPIRSQ